MYRSEIFKKNKDIFPVGSKETIINVRDGWLIHIDSMLSSLQSVAKERYIEELNVLDISQKHGTLSVRLSVHSDYLQEVITSTSSLCFNTCEICGQDGELVMIKGSFQTVCEDHYNQLIDDLL
jgi:hypothetical protein